MILQQDEHFLQFVQRLERAKAKYGENTEALQNYQVTKLQDLERQFRKALVRHRWGAEVYQAFIAHITEARPNGEKPGILMARPFFRERKGVFTAAISPALRDKDFRALYRFNVNSLFIEFAMKQREWAANRDGRKLLSLAEQVRDLRHELMECNLPLIISQARLFKQQNKRSYLTYMDLIQIGCDGLASAIDKWVGPYSTTFRAVIIGRVLGNFIKANSETFVHFYPADAQRLYRARTVLAKVKPEHIDYAEVCQELNRMEEEAGDTERTKPHELVFLLQAAQVVNASNLQAAGDYVEEEPNVIEQYPDEASLRPDTRMEEAEVRWAVSKAILELPLVDQKLLRMRGVEL